MTIYFFSSNFYKCWTSSTELECLKRREETLATAGTSSRDVNSSKNNSRDANNSGDLDNIREPRNTDRINSISNSSVKSNSIGNRQQYGQLYYHPDASNSRDVSRSGASAKGHQQRGIARKFANQEALTIDIVLLLN